MKRAVSHLPRVNKLVMKPANLQSAKQVRALIQRSISTTERAPHFSSRVVDFVTHSLDQEIDAFLRRHLFEMKAE